MDYPGGCCIARYGDDISKLDRIMLRFRPIAPKPVSDGSGTTGCVISAEMFSKTGRKRKQSKSNSGKSTSAVSSSGCNKKRRNDRKEVNVAAETVALPLLPAASDSSASEFLVSPAEEKRRNTPVCLDFGGCRTTARSPDPVVFTEEAAPDTAVISWVTVEDGTVEPGIACGEYGMWCCTDEEKKMRLERDTCPGFVSDGSGKVTWTNKAYRDLVMGSQDENNHSSQQSRRMMVNVWLVMKERDILACTAFTCRVRLQYTCRVKGRASMMIPCDVWRMNDGGCAWRLDTEAALCLGRSV